MVKKIKDRLQNKKGFTLVELIVVIVIILILAAVLVPNVTRYISQAKKATFQEEASSYLTEVQSYAAEKYATTNVDVIATDFDNNSAEPTYPLTGFDTKGGKATLVMTSASTTEVSSSRVSMNSADEKYIQVQVDKGAVKSFLYQNKTYMVRWTQSKGWEAVK